LAAGVGAALAVSAVAGLLADELYRDPPALRAMLRGHDLVTLVLVVPLLVISLARTRGAAPTPGTRARLVLLGTLAFATYNGAVYVFGSAFNDLFLVQVSTLGLAVVALAVGLARFDVGAVVDAGRGRRRAAAGLLAFLAVGLGAMWVVNAVRFAVTGATPAESELVLPLSSTHLGYALDLLLIVPSYAVAAVLLWRGSRWGSVLAPVLLVGGLLQQLTYVSALVFQSRAGIPGATSFDPGEPLVIAAYVVALWLVTPLRRSPVRP
jgi:hypothetical protein